jgi:hypothetical protein
MIFTHNFVLLDERCLRWPPIDYWYTEIAICRIYVCLHEHRLRKILARRCEMVDALPLNTSPSQSLDLLVNQLKMKM